MYTTKKIEQNLYDGMAEISGKLDAMSDRLSGKLDGLSGKLDAMSDRLSGKLDNLSDKMDARTAILEEIRDALKNPKAA